MIWNKIFWIIIADAWYLSKELREKAVDRWKQLITTVRGNMKNLMTKFQHWLLRVRQKVEMVFSVLKLRFHLETSLPHSEIWYFTHYILCLTAYQFNKFCKVAYSMLKLA
jgi:hypothetical protein